jgi:hypothetical protein
MLVRELREYCRARLIDHQLEPEILDAVKFAYQSDAKDGYMILPLAVLTLLTLKLSVWLHPKFTQDIKALCQQLDGSKVSIHHV